MRKYKELKVYERSYKAAKAIYLNVAAKFPKEERFSLASQIKRAATSIPLNIAEGYGKGGSEKEMLRFMYMARGSCHEVTVLLDFVKDFGYTTKEEHEKAINEYEEIGKMLTGFIKSKEQRA